MDAGSQPLNTEVGPGGPAEGGEEDMPLPHDPHTVFLAGLFVLAAVACLYVARGLVLPIVLAVVFKLLFQPLVRQLERIHVPRPVSALLCVALLLGVLAGFGILLMAPAAQWAQDLPQVWPKLEQRYGALKEPIDRVRGYLQQAGLGDAVNGMLGGINPAGILGGIAGGAGGFASSLVEMLLVMVYLLVSGDTFLRRLVEVLPRLSDKKQAVGISDHVERDLSAYLLTITLINGVVAVLVACVAWAFGISGPVLWGVVAFFLNYVPVLGPLAGVVLFLALGVFTQSGWFAVLPAACYLLIHTTEGEVITPMLLARRFTINPVAVMIGLLFWSWMWGVTGAVLAVPLLAVTKIMCDRLRPLRAFGHLLEG